MGVRSFQILSGEEGWLDWRIQESARGPVFLETLVKL